MKKNLLAIVLSVVMLALLMMPVLVSSAEENYDAKIGLSDQISIATIKNVKYLSIPVEIENNTELVVARYYVISKDGLGCFSFQGGDFKGSYEDDFGNVKEIAFEPDVNNTEAADRLKILQTASTNQYGITTKAGTLGYAYFVAPTAVGTYTFEIEVIDGAHFKRADASSIEASPASIGYTTKTVTYTVECESHTKGEAEVTVPATCTEKGEEVYKCTACGKVLETKEVAALDHDWDEGVTAEDVACGNTADVTYTCKREGCGETKDETGAKVEHNWVEDEEAYEAPKCEVKGKKHFNCSNPNCTVKTKTEDVDALEHVWDNGVADASKVCGETADVTYTCELCGKTRIETGATIEHDWKLDADKSVAPVCGTAGKNVYVCQRDNCPKGEKEEAVAALEHIWVEDIEAYEAPKCEVKGKKHFNCEQKNCPEGTKTEEVEALEHVFEGAKVVVTKPTADAEGLYTIACVRECGKVEEHKIAKLDKVVENDGLYFESEDATLPEDITIAPTGDDKEENGKVQIGFTFDSEYADLSGEVVFGMDTKELAAQGFKNFAIYTKDAEGNLVKVETEIKDGKLTFTADLEADYIFEAEIVKTSPETGDTSNVVVFAVVALMAVAALVVVSKKRFAL